MPLPAAAAAAMKAKQGLDMAKNLLGGGGDKKKKGGVGKKLVIGCFGCGSLIAIFLLGIFMAIFTGITGGVAGGQVALAQSAVPQMPDICTSITSSSTVPAAYPQVIVGVATAVGVDGSSQAAPFTLNATTCNDVTKNTKAMLLLAMAWTDSSWGTESNTSLSTTGATTACKSSTGAPIVAGFVPIANAAKAAGFSGQNLVTITAVSAVESDCGTGPGPCTPAAAEGVCPGPGTQGCNSYGFCGAFQIGLESWTNVRGPGLSYLGDWGLTTNITQAATDLATNTKYAFDLATNGSPTASQQTIAQAITSNWINHEVPANAYTAYVSAAQTAVDQAVNVALPSADYEGIIMMSPTAWKAAGITDPTNAADANAIMGAVVTNMNTAAAGAAWPGSDPSSTLAAFYAIDQTTPNTSLISSHIGVVVETFQASSGGVATVITLATNAATQNWHIGSFCSQGANGAAWSGCDEEWCADFATWVWWKSGVSIPDLPGVGAPGSTGTVWAWGNSHNLLTQTPQPGELALWGNGAHVSIVVSVGTGGAFTTVNGDDWTGAEPTLNGVFNPLGSWVVEAPTNAAGAGGPGPLETFIKYPGS